MATLPRPDLPGIDDSEEDEIVSLARSMMAIPPTTAAAATVDPNTWYELVNRNSGKALDVCNWSTPWP